MTNPKFYQGIIAKVTYQSQKISSESISEA